MSISPKRLCFYCTLLAFYFASQIISFIVLRSYNQDTYNNAFKIIEIYKKLSVKLNENTEVDNSGLYKIVQTKKSFSKSLQDITVVSQCSSNYFSSIENLFKVWKGPVSVAVFSEIENIEKTLWDMSRFINCNDRRDFGMQLVVPNQDTYIKNYNFAYSLLSASDKSVSCTSPYISSSNGRKNYNWTSLYPVNLLRNVAKSGSSTDYILVIDVDMIPSSNLRSDFLKFAELKDSNSDKLVYVVPVFETLQDTPVPQDKTELIKAVELREARPFYVIPCENCQKLTKYDEWLANKNPFGMKVLYQVEWKHPWEPFFISRREIPNFDERFKQYGLNRVSQICELHVAGYKFLVLNNAYLIHKGFKSLEDFHETKNKEMEVNRRVYARFKIEVKYKYPDSEKTC